MSNLFKYGFSGLTNVSNEPFVFDANSRVIQNDKQPKIIRPIEEKEDIEEEQETSKSEVDTASRAVLDDAMDTAKSIRDDAILQASKIIADAKAEAEAIKEQAHADGHKQGYEEGSMEAMKVADEYLENLKKEQEAMVASNNITIEKAVNDAQTKLVDFTCQIIEKLTGILVEDYKSVMFHMINNALTDAETSKKFVIKVSESNYTYISDNYDRLVGAGNSNIDIEIYGDAKLDKSQCIIETDNGIIDLSMEVQVRNLVTAIKLLSE